MEQGSSERSCVTIRGDGPAVLGDNSAFGATDFGDGLAVLGGGVRSGTENEWLKARLKATARKESSKEPEKQDRAGGKERASIPRRPRNAKRHLKRFKVTSRNK